MSEDRRPDHELTVHTEGEDPILARLAQREKSEEEVLREGRERAARAALREADWTRRYWTRFAIVAGGHFLIALGLCNFFPEDWRDALLYPLMSAVLTALAMWRGWHWLLAGVVVTLVPPIPLLLVGGDLPGWYIKVPMLGGIALMIGYATQWPTAQD